MRMRMPIALLRFVRMFRRLFARDDFCFEGLEV